MCGILGIVRARGTGRGLDESAFARMRDTMRSRGPDQAGLWTCPVKAAAGADPAHAHIALAQRRLIVRDPDAGDQPMVSQCGRRALVYNGEIYNDDELRRDLARCGVRFATRCDTETLFRVLERWGIDGLRRVRGMYALAWADASIDRVWIARDPLGIKPLYVARVPDGPSRGIVFASDPNAILAHPAITPEPDPVAISAYLTTIRSTLGRRTMFKGVECVLPGELIELDVSGRDAPDVRSKSTELWRAPEVDDWMSQRGAVVRVRDAVRESVRLHLASDVARCCFLSGGLDSTIITSETTRQLGDGVRTYASGSETGEGAGDDPAFASLVAERLGTDHTEAIVTRAMFAPRWLDMIDRSGWCLSTPNEVAINELARVVRAGGNVVALTGEGADELFGGYVPAMVAAFAYEQSGGTEPALFQLLSNAWVAPQAKHLALTERAYREAAQDEELIGCYRRVFGEARASAGAGGGGGGAGGGDPLEAHLRFHRRINLTGLLERLDRATMLESVEGRTPFADVRLAELASRLPMGSKFRQGQGTPGSKVALRDAFAPDLPDQVVLRDKASFPLPFQRWIEDMAPFVRSCEASRALLSREALDLVCDAPTEHWRLAWPLFNVALWMERWWGDGIDALRERAGEASHAQASRAATSI